MASKLASQFEMYQSNATIGMVNVLAKQLGVTADSLTRIGIGWVIQDQAWAFAERDPDGGVVGIVRRFLDGAKYAVEGSKRGLGFEVMPVTDGYDPGRQRWVRVTADEPCPICGGTKWCGVDGNVDPPRFVKCHRKVQGSKYTSQDGGHIHELVLGAFKPPRKYATPLPPSDLPVLVVEGHTDAAAALDLGFQAVSRPSATGVKGLCDLLRGRDVAIVGENDAGVGIKGMEKAFLTLQPCCPDVVKVVPPIEFKDLRAWLAKGGLTQEQLLQAIAGGSKDSAPNVLNSKAPLYIAERWLREEKSVGGVPTVRKRNGVWYEWNGRKYKEVCEDESIRGPLYQFLDGKSYKKYDAKGGCSLAEYETTRTKINDILDAMNMSCPVPDDAPCWLNGRIDPEASDLISFENGVLDVRAHLRGGTRLIPATPHLFATTAMPYEFDSKAQCPEWSAYLNSVFSSDLERIALAQEWLGYCMVPDTSMEKMMMLVGRPGSGKSTFLDILQTVIGRDQCYSTTFKDLCGDHGTAPLVNKLAFILADAHVPRNVDATQALERIKSITGQDRVPINRKFCHQVDCKLTGRFTIAVNELPELPDHSRSLERRLLLLYFPESFEGREDRGLKDRLPLEAPGIAVWALEGLRRLRARGRFTQPASSVPVIDEFRRSLTPVAEFMDECCMEGPQHWVLKRQVYDAWSMWAKERGLRPGIQSRFGQRILAQNPTITSARRSLGGKQKSVYSGIQLTPNARDMYLARAR
jgi:P4 family phage/plasmid primase-like protien